MLALDLLAAHLVGDFILQSDSMARKKTSDWRFMAVHVFCYTMPFVPLAIFYAPTPWDAFAFTFFLIVSHAVIDMRRWASGDKWPPKPIVVDQALHVVALAILARLLQTV